MGQERARVLVDAVRLMPAYSLQSATPREISEFIKYHNTHGLPGRLSLGAASVCAVVICPGFRGSTFLWLYQIPTVSAKFHAQNVESKLMLRIP
jgi:hypothetical protein